MPMECKIGRLKTKHNSSSSSLAISRALPSA